MAFSNYINLLTNLSAETKAIWGTMTPQHMVEHLTWQFNRAQEKLCLIEFIHPGR